MYALNHASGTKFMCRNYTTANVDAVELAALADERMPFSGRRKECCCKVGYWP